MQIVYEDAYLLIINKASNLLVHHSHYARNIKEDSLVEQVEKMHSKVYPLHRLDRKTSGLIMCAKKKENVAVFQHLFQTNEIIKKYIALLRGHTPLEGSIDTPVKNDRGTYKEAFTHFKLVKHIVLPIPVDPYPSSRYSIVEFTPSTGRMHQLRIHANKISHPIIGDPKHGNRHHNHMFINHFGIDTLFLHAHHLSFKHPFTKEQITINVPAPQFWAYFLEQESFSSVF